MTTANEEENAGICSKRRGKSVSHGAAFNPERNGKRMSDILDTIVQKKREEIERLRERSIRDDWAGQARSAPRRADFAAALERANGIGVIAEIKKASPSAGVIRADFDPPAIAKSYASGGAHCLSVLTDAPFFQGDIQYLRDVGAAVSLPLLRKDFILDPLQIFEAKLAGASAVLLIAECLTAAQMAEYVELTESLGMTTLVELYDRANLGAVLESGTRLVGINNRDLRTFHVDLRHTTDLMADIPSDRIVVSESGIKTPDDVARLHAAGVHAILVGETFMRSPDPGEKLAEMMGALRAGGSTP